MTSVLLSTTTEAHSVPDRQRPSPGITFFCSCSDKWRWHNFYRDQTLPKTESATSSNAPTRRQLQLSDCKTEPERNQTWEILTKSRWRLFNSGHDRCSLLDTFKTPLSAGVCSKWQSVNPGSFFFLSERWVYRLSSNRTRSSGDAFIAMGCLEHHRDRLLEF